MINIPQDNSQSNSNLQKITQDMRLFPLVGKFSPQEISNMVGEIAIHKLTVHGYTLPPKNSPIMRAYKRGMMTGVELAAQIIMGWE